MSCQALVCADVIDWDSTIYFDIDRIYTVLDSDDAVSEREVVFAAHRKVLYHHA